MREHQRSHECHSRFRRASRVLVAGTAVILACYGVASAKSPIPVNTCGQVVNGDGVLLADLDCTGFPTDALVLDRGRLNLAGFTITGGEASGIRCVEKCEVFSEPAGGRIVGAAEHGVTVGDGAVPSKATIRDVEISGNGSLPEFVFGVGGPHAGVHSTLRAKIKLENVVIRGNGGKGTAIGGLTSVNPASRSRGKLISCTVENNVGTGVEASQVTLVDSLVQNNGADGVKANFAKLDNTTIVNNGENGILASNRRVKAKDSVISGNVGNGIEGTPITLVLKNCDVSNNGGAGIAVNGKDRIKDSTITGNGGSGVDGRANMKIRGSVVNGNAIGVRVNSNKARVLDSEIRSNAFLGVVSESTSFDDGLLIVGTSMVLDNGTDASCGVSTVCADIGADREPSFTFAAGVNECDTSYDSDSGSSGRSWGICTFDCGNGSVTAGEFCDTGGESSSCDDDCTAPSCGDGNTNEAAGEECDDGNNTSEDGCSATCKAEFCGDAVVQAGLGELCDDGGFSATCDDDCTPAMCGDGVVNKPAGEKCDDGNTANGDGCDSTCKKE